MSLHVTPETGAGGRVPAVRPRAATALPQPEGSASISDDLDVDWAYGHLDVRVDTWDGFAATSLTVAEARALRDFLNDTLPKEPIRP